MIVQDQLLVGRHWFWFWRRHIRIRRVRHGEPFLVLGVVAVGRVVGDAGAILGADDAVGRGELIVSHDHNLASATIAPAAPIIALYVVFKAPAPVT